MGVQEIQIDTLSNLFVISLDIVGVRQTFIGCTSMLQYVILRRNFPIVNETISWLRPWKEKLKHVNFNKLVLATQTLSSASIFKIIEEDINRKESCSHHTIENKEV